ncbi:MAG: phosphoribosylamine--glycine ligase [Acidobacteriota bacterium]
MKALVIGSGGREHAILWALKRTSRGPLDLYCAPGNGGISQLAESVPIPPTDHGALVEFVRRNAIDLTIVGPEGPLSEGIVDEFERGGLRIMGPNRTAARLESSKGFAKNFMRRHGIPTADFHIARSEAETLEVLRSGKFGPPDAPVVVKADGLAAGKGVIVAASRLEGEEAVKELLTGRLISTAATEQLLVEEALKGREVSVLVFADGRDYVLMPPARDHKRIGDHDTGPNTGGMGAITDPSILDSETLERVRREIIGPTLAGARQEGFAFRGILFVGLMLTADGPKVLEYNVRFGDPETQAILVRLQSDLFEILHAITDGELRNAEVEWSDQSSACVVLASRGYPGSSETGFAINGLNTLAAADSVDVFHAGTSRSDSGEFLTAGGRVLGVTAAATTLAQALNRCYSAINKINWQGMQYRTDIGEFRESAVAGP